VRAAERAAITAANAPAVAAVAAVAADAASTTNAVRCRSFMHKPL
jgi:hypothetical protein